MGLPRFQGFDENLQLNLIRTGIQEARKLCSLNKDSLEKIADINLCFEAVGS